MFTCSVHPAYLGSITIDSLYWLDFEDMELRGASAEGLYPYSDEVTILQKSDRLNSIEFELKVVKSFILHTDVVEELQIVIGIGVLKSAAGFVNVLFSQLRLPSASKAAEHWEPYTTVLSHQRLI
jgi:hypothetical protein